MKSLVKRLENSFYLDESLFRIACFLAMYSVDKEDLKDWNFFMVVYINTMD